MSYFYLHFTCVVKLSKSVKTVIFISVKSLSQDS